MPPLQLLLVPPLRVPLASRYSKTASVAHQNASPFFGLRVEPSPRSTIRGPVAPWTSTSDSLTGIASVSAAMKASAGPNGSDHVVFPVATSNPSTVTSRAW